MDDSLQVTNGVVTATTTAIDPSTTSDFGATSEFSAVLSDNITYEPAPETTPTNQNNSSNQAANNTSGGNLETTVTPPTVTTLVKAGPASTFSIFAIVSIIGAVLHRMYTSRKATQE